MRLLKMHNMLWCLFIALSAYSINAESYEDRRCSCICPTIKKDNEVKFIKSFYRDNLPGHLCNCLHLVIPRIADKINETRIHAFCQQCFCEFEKRNTTIIEVVVIFLCCLILMLILYMVCIQFMEKLSMNRGGIIRERGFDEESSILLNDVETDSDDTLEPE